MFQFDTGFGRPDGPLLDLTVTGVVRISARAATVSARRSRAPAFDATLRPPLAGADGAAAARSRAARRAPRSSASSRRCSNARPARRTRRASSVRSSADFPAEEISPQVATAQRVLGGGLLLFAAVVAARPGCSATAQALGRLAAGRARGPAHRAALGLVRAERVLGRLLPATVMIAIAVALAVAGVLVAGLVEPLGALARVRAAAGLAAGPAGRGLGRARDGARARRRVVVVSTAARRARRGSAARAWPHGVLAAATGPARAPLVAGDLASRLTRSPHDARRHGARASRASSRRPTFAASLHRLEREPARYGWTADFGIADVKDAELARVAADPRVRDVQVVERDVRRWSADRSSASRHSRTGRARCPPRCSRAGCRRRRTRSRSARARPNSSACGVGDQVAGRSDGAPFTVTGVALATPHVRPPARYECRARRRRASRRSQRVAGRPRPRCVRVHDGVDPAGSTPPTPTTTRSFAREPPGEVANLLDLGALPRRARAVPGAARGRRASCTRCCDVTRRRGRDLGVLRALGLHAAAGRRARSWRWRAASSRSGCSSASRSDSRSGGSRGPRRRRASASRGDAVVPVGCCSWSSCRLPPSWRCCVAVVPARRAARLQSGRAAARRVAPGLVSSAVAARSGCRSDVGSRAHAASRCS